MQFNSIENLSVTTSLLYARCVRDAVREAMTKEYGSESEAWKKFKEYAQKQADDYNRSADIYNEKNREKIETGEKDKNGKPYKKRDHISSIDHSINGFEGFDDQAASKTLHYLTKSVCPVLETHIAGFSVTKAKNIEDTIKATESSRNRTQHVSSLPEAEFTYKKAELQTNVISALFPDRAASDEAVTEIGGPEGTRETYLQLMKKQLSEMEKLINTKTYVATDHIDPAEFDIEDFQNVCSRLQIRSYMQDGIHYFESYDVKSDVSRIKNLLGRKEYKSVRAVPAEPKKNANAKTVLIVAAAILAALLLATAATALINGLSGSIRSAITAEELSLGENVSRVNDLFPDKTVDSSDDTSLHTVTHIEFSLSDTSDAESGEDTFGISRWKGENIFSESGLTGTVKARFYVDQSPSLILKIYYESLSDSTADFSIGSVSYQPMVRINDKNYVIYDSAGAPVDGNGWGTTASPNPHSIDVSPTGYKSSGYFYVMVEPDIEFDEILIVNIRYAAKMSNLTIKME